MSFLSRSNKSPRRFPYAGLLASLLAVTAVFLAGEMAVRIYDLKHGHGLLSDYRNEIAKGCQPVVPWRTFGLRLYRQTGTTKLISSRHGELFPLEKPAGTSRIVCFGGSTTEEKIDGIHYPLALQTLLRRRLGRENIEVINVGNSGYATPHSIILLELDVIYWHPDIVILSHNINDLVSSYWPGLTYDYSNKYGDPFFASPMSKDSISCVSVLLQHSRFYWMLSGRIRGLFRAPPKGIAKRRHYQDTPAPLAIEIFRQNLRTFVQIAKAHRIKVILATQALVPEESYFQPLFFEPYNEKVIYPAHEEMVKHHRYFNEIIRQVAQEEDTGLVDNERLFAGDKRYFKDFVHNNLEGLHKLAGNYADYIVEEKLIP